MDSAVRYYIWFLLVISGLTALVRLVRPRMYTQIESERLSEPRARRTRTWLGLGALLLSPFILLYYFWGPLRPWMWLSAAIGMLSGAEQYTAARYHEFPRLLWHTRIFGVLSAAVTVLIYLFFLRK